jgi:hypothetical protein
MPGNRSNPVTLGNDKMGVFYEGVNTDCRGAQGAPRHEMQLLDLP